MAPRNSASNRMLSMKLLVNSKTQRVLYAEAGKDVVDFLFSLLTLPVSTVVKLLSAETMVGCVGNLYSSVDKLDDTYISRVDAKAVLLRPAGGGSACSKLLQLPEPPASPVLYRCNHIGSLNRRSFVTNVCGGMLCPSCGRTMATPLLPPLEPDEGGSSSVRSVAPRAAGAGFVQGIVTYTVTDDLKVAPLSSISGIALFNSFGVAHIGSLQEKTVQLGYDKGLEIPKASLQSKTVLTDVFLGKKRKE